MVDASFLDQDSNFVIAEKRGLPKRLLIGLCLRYNAPLWFGAFVLQTMNKRNWRNPNGRKADYYTFVNLFWEMWNKPLSVAANAGKLLQWEKRLLAWRQTHDVR